MSDSQVDQLTLAERLKLARGEMTQEEFAEEIGVHKNTVSNYERGSRKVDARFLRAISDRFRISPTWLLYGVGDKYLAEGSLLSILPPLPQDEDAPPGVPVIMPDGQPLTANGHIVLMASEEQARLVRTVMSAPPHKQGALIAMLESAIALLSDKT